ncbi:hypothetical protein PRUB_a5214 [Pseudoalteromonas rubra]|uniref:Uncharacterized protein n=1 Tax=Pseudoalteromonas rubra TaxID=43658 RepID=A0A8T0CCK4_9GAMM|nr:hypothetical protein [Pseudoalteromonas rubra]KAF7787715.1 hypothetical protein PRUB_a5214 [Pseudoalteromonas rubra]
MSVTVYNSLRNQPGSTKCLGSQLPELTAARLIVESQLVDAQQLQESVQSIEANAGWAMWRDALVLCTTLDSVRQDVIEGQWCNEQVSLSARLVAPQQYRLVRMHSETHTGAEQVYRDQRVLLRDGLDEQHAIYRLWYQKQNIPLLSETAEPIEQWAWRPVAQQFMGWHTSQALQKENS